MREREAFFIRHFAKMNRIQDYNKDEDVGLNA